VPDVHVHVEQPKPRGIRVEVDAITGERVYRQFELDEEEGEGEG
jgi:hypothetical protein